MASIWLEEIKNLVLRESLRTLGSFRGLETFNPPPPLPPPTGDSLCEKKVSCCKHIVRTSLPDQRLLDQDYSLI